MFFFVGAGDVAERSVVHGRREVGKSDFALRIGVRRVAAEKARLQSHGVFGGVLRMILHLNGRRDVAQDGSGLGKGAGGAQKKKERDGGDGDFHKLIQSGG